MANGQCLRFGMRLKSEVQKVYENVSGVNIAQLGNDCLLYTSDAADE